MPLGRATRRLRRLEGPLVTVVLAISDEETSRISICLDTLRDQTHRNLEVLVIGYGDTTRCLAVAQEHAAGDWRIRILRQRAGTQAQARNLAAGKAKGSYLLFVNGGDDLPRTGIEHLVAAIEVSGSDFAVGKLDQPLTVNRSVNSPFEAAHRHDLFGVGLTQAPVAITDLGLGNRLFRRRYYIDAGLRFADRPAGATELAVTSYLSGTFDLLHQATYVPTGRRDGVSVGSVLPVLDGLVGWIGEQRRIAQMIDSGDLQEVRRAWLTDALDHGVQPFLDDVERATQEQWQSLRAAVESLLAGAAEDWDGELSAESKVKLWLLRDDRREELADYVADRWFELGHRATLVEQGKVLARLPFFDDPAVGIPRRCFEMPPAHTPLRVEAREVRWHDRTLEVVLFARIDYVGFDGPPEVEVSLLSEDRSGGRAGAPIPLRVERHRDFRLNHAHGHRYQDYSHGGVTAYVDADELAALLSDGESRRWTFQVRLGVRGLWRDGGVDVVDPRASAGMAGTGYLGPRTRGSHRLGIREAGGRLEVYAAPGGGPGVLGISVSGRVVTGELETGGRELAGVQVSMGDLRAEGKLTGSGAVRSFSLEVPPRWAEVTSMTWQIEALDPDGGAHPIAWTEESHAWLPQPAGRLAPGRSGAGELQLFEAADLLIVDEAELDGRALHVRAHWLGAAPGDFELSLKGTPGALPGTVTSAPGAAHVTAEFSMTWDPWGLGQTPVPAERYYFKLATGSGPRPGKVWLGTELVSSLFETTHTADYTFRAIRMGLEAGIFLRAPLTDRDRGPYGQKQLQLAYAANQDPLDEQAFYLQSYAGASATDSQLAIHHELRRTHPGLRLYWGVADASARVPEGGIPVLMHSPEWYDVMATAKHLCLNIDVDRWFHARPGQRVLQTFHGYPAKSMGIRMWQAKGYTPRRIALELARTSGDWELILTPSPEMDVHYRVEYAYTGRIHSEGYPRDDALVGPDAERIRRETRARLGLQPHHKVVLYAPTWRDDLAVNWREAHMVQNMDLHAAARQLGPDYVFLLRGHRFNAAVQRSASTSAQLIDVTGHPEINDLILASDVAVLDYSSLRFDFSLTGRPMVFLVPDIADYVGGVRGFLFDYRDTAPGPLVATGDEVVEQLRDLEAIQREHAAAYKTFDERFNRYMDGRAAERVVAAFMGDPEVRDD